MSRRERWNPWLGKSHSNGGSPICHKHDFIESNSDDPEMAYEIAQAASAAREDGVAMENALRERKERIEELESEVAGLEEETRELKYRIAHPEHEGAQP